MKAFIFTSIGLLTALHVFAQNPAAAQRNDPSTSAPSTQASVPSESPSHTASEPLLKDTSNLPSGYCYADNKCTNLTGTGTPDDCRRHNDHGFKQELHGKCIAI